MYPDPVTHPGLTWPADRPHVEGYNPARDGQAADRIDLMYASPQVRPTSVRIAGEGGSKYSDIVVDPWPSDHRAIVAEFELALTPVPALLAAAQPLNRSDDDVVLRYHTSGELNSRIVVSPPEAAEPTVLAGPLLATSGDLAVPAGVPGVGQHHVELVSEDNEVLADTTIWVAEPDAKPTLLLDRKEYAVGQGVGVRWENAPGNRADWIAVFDRGADPATSRRKIWTYTGATVVGEHTLDGSQQPRRWPLPAGDYVVHLLLDDVWDSMAQVDFSVR